MKKTTKSKKVIKQEKLDRRVAEQAKRFAERIALIRAGKSPIGSAA